MNETNEVQTIENEKSTDVDFSDMPVLMPANYDNDQFFADNGSSCEIFFDNSEVEINETDVLESMKLTSSKNNSINNDQSIESLCLSKKEDISSPRVSSTVDATDVLDKESTIINDKIKAEAECSKQKSEELLFAVTSSMNLTELAERLYSSIDSEQVNFFLTILLTFINIFFV